MMHQSQHTSAALTINENYDPDVRKGIVHITSAYYTGQLTVADMDAALDDIVPEGRKWLHDAEGPEYDITAC